MDPRHPEEAIVRMRELMKQYDRIETEMEEANTSARLGQLELEGSLVIQEICLVAPRIHEAMMQTSRQRRHDLAHGVVEKPVEKPVEKSIHRTDVVTEVEDPYKIEEPKPKKKTTRKKKTAKKAEK